MTTDLNIVSVCACYMFIQVGMREEEIRRSRDEMPLGKIPSRGEQRTNKELQYFKIDLTSAF